MSGIGAQLPPHLLAKRKRKSEETAEDAPPTASGAKPSPSPDSSDQKRRRVIGPAMPPAPLNERPSEPSNIEPEDDESSDDDDFGPSLPPTGAEQDTASETTATAPREPSPGPAKPKRDDWMTMAPEQDGLASRMDPSKQRPRGFNTSKGVKAPPEKGGDSSSWHETPEQKRKRLEDEMLGISKATVGPSKPAGPSQKDRDEARRLKDQVEKSRGPSLMEQHTARTPKNVEDDPSKRAFDKDKDMSIGGVGRARKNDMVKNAAGFSSKFSGGSFL